MLLDRGGELLFHLPGVAAAVSDRGLRTTLRLQMGYLELLTMGGREGGKKGGRGGRAGDGVVEGRGDREDDGGVEGVFGGGEGRGEVAGD